MKTIKFIFLLFFLNSRIISVSAQSFTIPDQVTFGSADEDDLNEMILTPDDGYLMCGTSFGGISGDKTEPSFGYSDFWLVKFDNTLQPQWQKSFGGNSGDISPSIINVTGGGYLLVGSSGSPISGNKTVDTIGGGDIWVIKLNATGGIVWQNVYGGDNYELIYRSSVVELSDGSFVIGCSSNSDISGNKTENGRGLKDYWIIKIDSLGNIIWDKTFGGTDEDILYSLCKDTNDNIFIAGHTLSPVSGDKIVPNFGFQNLWLISINSSNASINWQQIYGGDLMEEYPSVLENNGFLYLVSQSNSNIFATKTEASRGDFDLWFLKIDKNTSNIIWDKTMGGSFIDFPASLVFDNNKIYTTGNVFSGISGEVTESPRGGGDIWTICLDTSKALIWEKRIGGTLVDGGIKVLPSSSGSYFIAGNSQSNISFEKDENCRGNYDYWIIQLDVNLSINEINENNTLNVFPNPTESYLNVENDMILNSAYFIYDITGKIIHEGILVENRIDVKSLCKGFYSLVVKTDVGVYSTKFIKE